MLFFLLLGLAAGTSYIILNPPLAQGAVYFTPDEKTVLLSIGNRAFGEITIKDVAVNGDEKPLHTVMQLSNALNGFILVPGFEQKGNSAISELMSINEVAIPPRSDPKETYEKMDKGLATAEDKIFGVGAVHEQEIREITIRYNYLGLPFRKTVNLEM